MKWLRILLQTLLAVSIATAVRGQSGHDTTAPQPYELTFEDRADQPRQRVGWVCTPSVRVALFDWLMRRSNPRVEQITIPPAVSAPVIHIAFTAFAAFPTFSLGILSNLAGETPVNGPVAFAVPHGAFPKEMRDRIPLPDSLPAAMLAMLAEPFPKGIPFPVGVPALSLSTDPADIAALDSRLAALDIAAIATFARDALKPGMDVVLYQIVVNRSGTIAYHQRRGEIRTDGSKDNSTKRNLSG